MPVDIVMPTYNNREELRAALDSLRSSARNDINILVCVDGSADGTLEYLERTQFPFSLRVFEHPDHGNHGRAAARNLALPYLASEFVLLLDSDMCLTPGAIDAHVRMLSDRDCVSVGDVIYLNGGENLWARYLATRGKNKNRAGAKIRPLDFVTANSAMRAEHLRAVNGFDEELTGYGGEDTEFALHLMRDRGIPFVFNAAARAETVEEKTVAQGLLELRRYAATNLRTIRAKYRDFPAPYWIDHLESGSTFGRLLEAAMNPLTDRVVDGLLRISPFAIQRRLLNYKVLRAVVTGYREEAP